MIYQSLCDPDTPLYPVRYKFLEPVKLKIEDKDGVVTEYGCGIGDSVEVLEPQWCYPVGGRPLREKIPLIDGRFIIDYPLGMRYERD